MRVALLTNFIPPYRLRFFEALAREAGELRVFVSTRMEGNRDWNADWGSLDVVVQKTLTLQKTWREHGFAERQEVHIPYDTARRCPHPGAARRSTTPSCSCAVTNRT